MASSDLLARAAMRNIPPRPAEFALLLAPLDPALAKLSCMRAV